MRSLTRRHALIALSLVAFIVALFLVHASGHQTVQGLKPDSPTDPDGLGEPTKVRVECAPAADGPRLDGDGEKTRVGFLKEADGVHEDAGYTLEQEGVDQRDAFAVCDRVRAERLTHAGELGVLGLLFAGGAHLLTIRDRLGRRPRRERASPTGAVV